MKTRRLTIVKNIFFTLITVFIVIPVFGRAPVFTETQINEVPPRIIRTCCAFGADLHMPLIPFVKYSDITAISEIGEHGYLGNEKEGNGIIYTRNGGFIDLGHLRDCADWTAFLYNRIIASKEKPELQVIKIGNEAGQKTLYLEIPENFDSMQTYELAAKMAYDLSLWHEMATWFGASYVPLLPERYSSFSPEDLYSNLLGTQLAVKALQSKLDYETAMTQMITKTLDNLDASFTIEETEEAMKKVENLWWSGKKPLPSKKILLKHYLGAGYTLTPWLLPETDNLTNPFTLEKPNEELNKFYRLEIKLNYKIPVKKIFGKSESRIITQQNFGDLFRHIQKEINHLDFKTNFKKSKKEMRNENRNTSVV